MICSDLRSSAVFTKWSAVDLRCSGRPSEWVDAWFNTTVVNQSLITDPTVCPPGFNPSRHLWSTLNRFRTGQGRCVANLVRWHQASDPSWLCGNHRQTMESVTIFWCFMVTTSSWIRRCFMAGHTKQAIERLTETRLRWDLRATPLRLIVSIL